MVRITRTWSRPRRTRGLPEVFLRELDMPRPPRCGDRDDPTTHLDVARGVLGSEMATANTRGSRAMFLKFSLHVSVPLLMMTCLLGGVDPGCYVRRAVGHRGKVADALLTQQREQVVREALIKQICSFFRSLGTKLAALHRLLYYRARKDPRGEGASPCEN